MYVNHLDKNSTKYEKRNLAQKVQNGGQIFEDQNFD